MNLIPAQRVNEIPTYIFSELSAIRAEIEKRGIKLLSLGIGDPDQPTPLVIVQKMQEAISKGQNHSYSPYEGSILFRTAVRDWFRARFSVELDPDTEILALIGSKEGIGHFPIAFCNPGDICLYPSPGYPVYPTAISLAGGKLTPFPLKFENDFLPILDELEKIFVLQKPRFMYLNFPSNPTTAVCSKALLSEIVYLAKKYGVLIASDNAYSEIYYDDSERPPSILEIDGAKDISIEFHSLSKTFNMTGWRIGFAVGNPRLISALLRVKTNIDSGPLLSVQEAGAFALSQSDILSHAVRKVYQERRRLLLEGLDRIGVEYFRPRATFYVWAKVPKGEDSMAFVRKLIEKHLLVVTPGIGFGKEGEHFFRMAMTVGNSEIQEAVNRLGQYLQTK